MKTLEKILTLTAAVLALGCVGCTGGDGRVGAAAQAISLQSLPPDLPGCESVSVTGNVHVRHIDGARDLYVAFSGSQPLCIDSGEGMTRHFQRNGLIDDDSGDSNPMPGVSNCSSNPMPGTDPASSNPMPGQANYGQPGYTSGH